MNKNTPWDNDPCSFSSGVALYIYKVHFCIILFALNNEPCIMNYMEELKSYIPAIIDSLKQLDPYKIIIFGSVAQETYNENSDIDIAVIINKDNIPQSYDEKLANKILVRNAILDLSFEVPIDLLVYTKKEFFLLQENNKPFMSELTDNGKVIYEKVS